MLTQLVILLTAAGLACWLGPALWARRRGHQFEVRSSGNVVVNSSRDAVSRWIRDTTNLSTYELKCDRCTSEVVAGLTQYTVHGRFFGFPWTGTFDMHPTPDGGFHSVMIHGPHEGNADGGFRMRTVPGGTQVTHYEAYRINVWIPFAALFRPLVQSWLDRTIAAEIQILANALVDLPDHRQGMVAAVTATVHGGHR